MDSRERQLVRSSSSSLMAAAAEDHRMDQDDDAMSAVSHQSTSIPPMPHHHHIIFNALQSPSISSSSSSASIPHFNGNQQLPGSPGFHPIRTPIMPNHSPIIQGTPAAMPPPPVQAIPPPATPTAPPLPPQIHNHHANHHFQLAAQQHAQQISLLRYKEQLGARLKGKQDALEFMIQRLALNDDMWKVVDLEEYTLENPDIVITDKHIHDLACALRINTKIVAIRLPECEGLVTWNALWPFFESLKHNQSVTRMFVSSSGKIFGHMVSVFLTNSILGFFDCNYTIRTLGSFSKAPVLKKEIRVSLNRNILHHYVPKKVALLRRLWHSRLMADHPLKGSGNDALSLLFEFDEHFQMIKSMAKGRSMKCPKVLGSNPFALITSFAAAPDVSDDDCDFEMEELECPCGEYTKLSLSKLGKRPSDILQDIEFEKDCHPSRKRSRTLSEEE